MPPPISFDASTYSNQVGTYSHTTSGSNRVLFGVSRGACPTFAYNGVPLTNIANLPLTGVLAGFTPLGLWYLQNPALGAHNVVVDTVASMVASYKDVSPAANLLDAFTTNISPGVSPASLTTSITTRSNGCWVIVAEASYAFGPPPTAGAGLTFRQSAIASSGIGSLFDSNGAVNPAGLFSGTTNQGAGGAFIYHIMQAFALPPPSARGKANIGVPAVLSGNTIYGLPATTVSVEWTAGGAAILEVSNDEINWATVSSLGGAGTTSATDISALYIRPSVDVTALFRKKKDRM